MRIAVTGASGFVGTRLVPLLEAAGHEVRPVARNDIAREPTFEGIQTVIHLAGIAHRSGRATPHVAIYEAANARLPVAAYRAARAAGVRRFIHVSTISVLSGHRGKVLRESLPAAPTAGYDRSKARAEAGLLAEAGSGGPELLIVRPPLVYGPGAKANLASLCRMAALPVPLPFASVGNARSLVGLDNFCDALTYLATYRAPIRLPAIHVTDGVDLSLGDLVTNIRQGLGRPPALFPFPAAVLRLALTAVGQRRRAEQLFGDQRVDASALRALGWRAPYPPAYDLHRMAAAWRDAQVS